MRDLRIVFMGTPAFAVPVLEEILNNDYEVVGVITAPDKPAGRGRKLHTSAVKDFAVSKGLKVLQPRNLKDDEFLNQLAGLKANLQIVVAFRMLPEKVWAMPKYGTINLHASLLPQYRGAAPINWVLINGEEETGVTTFYINERIDTGEIILQERTRIDPEENAGSLHDRLMLLGAELVLKTIELVEKDLVVPIKQDESEKLKPAPKIHRETCRINWHMAGNNIVNHIRGLSPYPAAWTYFFNGEDQSMLKIYSAKPQEAVHTMENGTVIRETNDIKIAVSGGYISLLEIQLPGKKKMAARDWLNGLNLKDSAKVL